MARKKKEEEEILQDDRELIAEMLDKENIDSIQKEFILNSLFKKKP